MFSNGYDPAEGYAGRQRDYQLELAQSLIGSVGMEAAIDCARQNEWEGVLARIMGLCRGPRRTTVSAKPSATE